MNSKYKYLIKNTGILAISNFSSILLVFFLVPIYTSVLSTAEYGTYDLAMSTVLLLYPVLTVNIVDGVMRFSMEKGADHTKIISIALRFIFVGMFIMTVLLYINRTFHVWNDLYGVEQFILFYYIFYVLNQLMIQFSKGLERIKDMGVAGVIGTIVTILSNVLFLLVWKLGLPGFFSASILGQAIPAVYLAVRVKIWKYIGTVIDKTLQKEMLLYAVPLMMTTIGWWVNTASDKYVVTFICGVAANGLLSIAYKIPTILNTLQGIFIQAWQVSAIKEYGSEEAKRFYRETFLYLNALMCVGCAGLIWLTRPIAHILFAKDFYQAWVFVPFLLVSSMLNAASGYIGPILAAKKDSKSMAIAAFGGAGVNVVLNIALVYLMGIQGATIATVIASYIIYIIRKRATGDAVVSAKYKWIMTSWVVLCIQAACEVWIHNYLITGLLFVVMLFIYRKSILSVGRKLLKR